MAESANDVSALAAQALTEIGAVLDERTAVAAERLVEAVLSANRVACFGVGREGLMIRAFCMRLMHLGFDAHMVGDMTTPPVRNGDLLIVTAGTGSYSLGQAILRTGNEAGAQTLVVTAQPDGPIPSEAELVIYLPAQTMADDQFGDQQRASLLPMGSLFEIAELVFFDLVSILLRDRTGQSPDDMRARHTNLE